jgi:hypothetical protein
MRSLFACITMILAIPVFCSEQDVDRVRKLLASENYTVTWAAARLFDFGAELEIGNGSGHGQTLSWLRFRPEQGQVNVLSVQFDWGLRPYQSKWPPDRAPVTVKHARMKKAAYAALLHHLAVVDSATLKRTGRHSSSSSHSLWVFARLTANKETLINLDWAGYAGNPAELQNAKPNAAVTLAWEAVKGLDFREHTLTAEERGWASAKFACDWKKHKESGQHWFMRENSIITIGVVGDATALPTLGGILHGDPKDRCVYHAINAITRLTKTDVRDRPVEEMDVEKTRQKVLDLLRKGHRR